MKKTTCISIALSLIISASMLMTGVGAAMKAVGEKSVNFGTPKVDGTIGADEWKNAALINLDASTAKPWSGIVPADFKSAVKVLWDETGLYFSGTITDSTYKASSEGKYDGDAFQISIDAGQVFKDTTETRAIFYSFGCYESGKAMIQRQESKNNAIVYDGEGVTIKTVKTSTGWSFETLLPWSMIKEDVKLKAGKDIDPKAGFKLNLMICYMDRDADGKMVNAFGTTLTGEEVKYDWGPSEHGITLNLVKTAEKPATTETTSPKTSDTIQAIITAAAFSAAVLVLVKRKTK